MAVGSDQRRQERRPLVAAVVPPADLEAALDLLAIGDLAWHDCYGPSQLAIAATVLDDILLLCDGNLSRMIRLTRGAIRDFRDLRVAADERRRHPR